VQRESTNLMEKAYRSIRNMMLQQKLGPGQKLIYRDLSEKLQMSKTPVMYALGRLEQEGFIELVPNSGYSVKEIDLKEIEDLFDMREALETHAVMLAVERKSPRGGLKLLENKIREHQEYLTPTYDRKKLVLDAEVHLQIAALSGNQVLLELLRNVFEHLYLRSRVELMDPARLSVAPSEHRKILGLIRKGEASALEQILTEHIHAAKQAMVSCLCKQAELASFSIQRA
jgi:DNA-binding GntR family transcriptional regulator